ncbi:META domain protein [Kordia sp. SMS9]|uniref:DUF6438 domain-containing protein n=1 Tax=Kordia sp. SMS9 TaxID=2282170 RepID=UPI000E100F1F|nr:DUF6438 domain-containing protein [Kordia sp. SMS9]AXG71812.1 META domain protein [Kordia sp. SMS9]
MKTTLLSIIVLALISCDASTKEFVGSSWKVVELKNSGTTVKVTDAIILKVNSDTEFSLKLDVNNCFGTYSITGKSNIKLQGLACTEMCCDSEFSKAVVAALYKVSTIKLTKDEAILSSDDVKITFKRQKVLSPKEMKATNTSEKFMGKEKIPTEETTNVGMFENPNKVEETPEMVVPKGDFIELYKSPCKGTCEEFTMQFYEDGTVVYTGKFNAQVQGKHAVKLAPSKVKSLFNDFEQSNFMSFQDKYDDPKIMDIQNTYLTYKGKKIHIRYKYNAPKELQTLLEKVETQAKSALEQLKKK